LKRRRWEEGHIKQVWGRKVYKSTSHWLRKGYNAKSCVFLGGFLHSVTERMKASVTCCNKAILPIHFVEMVLDLDSCPDDLEQHVNNKNGRS